MDDPTTVRQLLANAERLNASEMAIACLRRLFELTGSTLDDPVNQLPLG